MHPIRAFPAFLFLKTVFIQVLNILEKFLKKNCLSVYKYFFNTFFFASPRLNFSCMVLDNGLLFHVFSLSFFLEIIFLGVSLDTYLLCCEL